MEGNREFLLTAILIIAAVGFLSFMRTPTGNVVDGTNSYSFYTEPLEEPPMIDQDSFYANVDAFRQDMSQICASIDTDTGNWPSWLITLVSCPSDKDVGANGRGKGGLGARRDCGGNLEQQCNKYCGVNDCDGNVYGVIYYNEQIFSGSGIGGTLTWFTKPETSIQCSGTCTCYR